MNTNAISTFRRQLATILPASSLVDDLARRVALSTDASFYSLTPQLIVYLSNVEQVRQVMALANLHGVALTFRAAGTSLSGQAITDSVLVMLTPDWQQYEISHEGEFIALQPGLIGATVNRLLLPFRRKIGPDPASINSCKVGGIAANNASGMCCGVKNNSYHTLADMHLVLADGSELNTADEDSVAAFRQSHADLLDGLSSLAETIHAAPELRERIRHQYRLKNTMGYGLNALLDYTDPIDMLTHLMIGSEGTLGFIANITYRTLPLPVARQTGLFLFSSSDVACEVIPLLAANQVQAVELMDTRSLRAVSHLLSPFYDKPVEDGHIALLVDLGADSDEAIMAAKHRINDTFSALEQRGDLRVMQPFTEQPQRIEQLWQIRKGLFPAVGAVRDTGTTVIIEDVAFPLAHLSAGLAALEALFTSHGIDDAIIFGHALDGNVHFVFSQDVSDEGMARYEAFMAAVAHLVTEDYNGTLKAEHGTGRNMAPFLRNQWGDEGVAIMARIKALLDPQGILNPGVVINDDPRAHLKDIKTLPAVDEHVDKCIECGFCEADCPSLNYTLSPRQRIALHRRAKQFSGQQRREIESAFSHLVVDSCAATGLCGQACPVGINTGDWVKQQRQQRAGHGSLATTVATHFGAASSLARGALKTARYASHVVGTRRAEKVSRWLNQHSGHRIPVLLDTLTSNGTAVSAHPTRQPQVIYIPTCPSRLFGQKESEQSLTHVILRILDRAGIDVVIPDGLDDACCGQPFESKGYLDAAAITRDRLVASINKADTDNSLPVIMDASPCARSAQALAGRDVYDVCEYLLSIAVPNLKISPTSEPVMLHVTCSSRLNDNGQALRTLASLCAEHVIEPPDISCCGFAGDKGLTQPGLNEAALSGLAGQIPDTCRRGYSNSRTCEIGLSRHSGIDYQHIAFLLDEVSASG